MDRARAVKLVEEVMLEHGEHLTPDRYAMTSTFGNIGIDSLSLLQMIMVLEDKAAIMISDAQIVNMRTVGDVVQLLEKSF